MKSKNYRRGFVRGKVFYFLGRNLVGGIVAKARNFKGEKYKLGNEPFLLFANHADNLDPAYEMIALRKYIRFVMSDHLTNNAVIRGLLNFIASPIVKHQDQSSDVLFDEIKNTVRAGVNVGVHVEGRKTTTGETCYISPRNAILAKECGCRLITYKMKGGYFKAPRWADSKRNGPVFGEIVNIYSAEEIKNMTAEELYSHICEDLYVNAYEEQRKQPIEYICENPAQSVETAVYVCPKCENIGTLTSKGDAVFCNCGFKATVDNFGFWHGENLKFDSLCEWNSFQKNVVKALTDEKKGTDELVFSDSAQMLFEGTKDEKKLLSDNAELSLFADRIEIKTQKETIPVYLSDIKRIDSASKMILIIVTEDKYYSINSKILRSAEKYVVAVRFLLGKDNKSGIKIK